MFQQLFAIIFLAFAELYIDDHPSTQCTAPPSPSRTRWNIVESCLLTLILCVWQAVHPNLPRGGGWFHKASWEVHRVMLALICFLLPEWTVYGACNEWWAARKDAREREDDKDVKWSKAHSFFAAMGGFACRTGQKDLPGWKTLNSSDYLRHVHNGDIAKPAQITEDDIWDHSKSDTLGKLLLGSQMIWFMVQAGVRRFGARHFTVTLIELDTICMCVLAIFIVYFWWNKPLRAERPHIFYIPSSNRDSALSCAEKGEPTIDPSEGQDTARATRCSLYKRLNDFLQVETAGFVALCVTWIIFGGLHMTAWHYPFATSFERFLWHFAALSLTLAPSVLIAVKGLTCLLKPCCIRLLTNLTERIVLIVALSFALFARLILIALMIASLRSLPCSAYGTVSWINYIPHFSY